MFKLLQEQTRGSEKNKHSSLSFRWFVYSASQEPGLGQQALVSEICLGVPKCGTFCYGLASKMTVFTSKSESKSQTCSCPWASHTAMLYLSFLICNIGDGDNRNASGAVQGATCNDKGDLSPGGSNRNPQLSLLSVWGMMAISAPTSAWVQGGKTYPYIPPAPTHWVTIPLSGHFQVTLWKQGSWLSRGDHQGFFLFPYHRVVAEK